MISINVKTLDGSVFKIQGRQGDSLMEVLREHEWGVPAICGGILACGTCQVYLDEEWLGKFPGKDPEEQELLDVFDSVKGNSRLSCQLSLQAIHDGLKLTIAPDE